jgi:hypothetical protein
MCSILARQLAAGYDSDNPQPEIGNPHLKSTVSSAGRASDS